MNLNILFHGYCIMYPDGIAIQKTFKTKTEAITFYTGFNMQKKLSRRLEWNQAKKDGVRLKKVFVALN